jgi:hypothetical protein
MEKVKLLIQKQKYKKRCLKKELYKYGKLLIQLI